MFDSKVTSILLFVLEGVSMVYVIALIVLILTRREMLPIKIKSPRLMLLSIFANLFIIISVSIIQVSEEHCVNTYQQSQAEENEICKYKILETFSIILGYVIIGFTEPLAVIAYVLRAIRLRDIYDA